MKQKRVTNVLQLQPQDKIWSIDNLTGRVVIIEFVCVHPHDEKYSVFLNDTYDGLPKFYNEKLEKEKWWRYDESIECWRDIYTEQKKWVVREGQYIDERLKEISRRLDESEKRMY